MFPCRLGTLSAGAAAEIDGLYFPRRRNLIASYSPSTRLCRVMYSGFKTPLVPLQSRVSAHATGDFTDSASLVPHVTGETWCSLSDPPPPTHLNSRPLMPRSRNLATSHAPGTWLRRRMFTGCITVPSTAEISRTGPTRSGILQLRPP